MKSVQTIRRRGEFEPVLATEAAQAAVMVLQPGEKSDETPSNEHPLSEQWLYVVQGTGSATVIPRKGKRRNVRLQQGTLLVIERGERHQIKNTGKRALHTINVYVPPAYRSDGRLRHAEA